MSFRTSLLFLLMLCCAAAPASAQNRRADTIPGAQNGSPKDVPRNVILMIADGCGPASYTMARDFVRDQRGRSTLTVDGLKVGSIRTFSADSRVTDSAAGATAFACATKTNNGYVGMDSLGRPVASVLEAAEQQGMATGLVATSRITHATPASFAAHTPDRWTENEIARQMLTQNIEVLLGGGWRHFLPESEGGQREDGRNLIAEAEDAGYTYVTGRSGFDRAGEAPLLGLFSKSHMAFDIDRDPSEHPKSTSSHTLGAQPSLAQMTAKAIDLLSGSEAGREKGFFLVVEGSRIDHAGHDNDAAAHLRDVLAYDEALARALQFARRDGRTLLVSTADHETGGLSLGRSVDGKGVYAWKPEVLAEVQSSHRPMVRAMMAGTAPAAVLRRKAGIDNLTTGEREALQAALDTDDGGAVGLAISEIVGRRAVVGWTSTGHTAVDVGLYAFGPGRARFIGHHDNTAVGAILADLLDFDLEALTEQLRERMAEDEAAAGRK